MKKRKEKKREKIMDFMTRLLFHGISMRVFAIAIKHNFPFFLFISNRF